MNNKKNGKGKDFDQNGKLIYEGEFLNGKRYGKGKEYNFDGKLLFEGEYINGKLWKGKLKSYIKDILQFTESY